jgi:hypothetical protein
MTEFRRRAAEKKNVRTEVVLARREYRTARADAILQEYFGGAPIAQIGKKYEIHQSYAAHLAKRRGLSARGRVNWG